MKLYELRAENIVAAGGPMHRMADDCYDMWTKLFKTKQAAKDYAQEWHKKEGREEKLEWYRSASESKMPINSQDCGWVMYHIDEIEVEE